MRTGASRFAKVYSLQFQSRSSQSSLEGRLIWAQLHYYQWTEVTFTFQRLPVLTEAMSGQNLRQQCLEESFVLVLSDCSASHGRLHEISRAMSSIVPARHRAPSLSHSSLPPGKKSSPNPPIWISERPFDSWC